MPDAHFTARYRIETPLPLEHVADVIAGEQSCPVAGVASIREAWDAVTRGEDLETASRSNKPLANAVAHFGARS